MKASMYNMELDLGGKQGEMPALPGYDPFTTPYALDEGTFPRYESIRDQIFFLLGYAILAPSSHNTQPWKFLVTDDGIAVYADYSRRLPVADPGNRELIMSVGAAIMNLRVAAAHFGFSCIVEHNRSGDSEGPLAFLRLSPQEELSAPERKLDRLFAAITRRHTNRHPFLMARVPDQVIATLDEFSGSSPASVFISRDGAFNQRVADLIASADVVQLADPSFRKELAEWMRPNHTRRPDGMTGASFGVNDLVSLVGPWATKTFDLGRLRAARDKNLCLEAPALIVLSSEDELLQWLEVGQLLERILLTLTRNAVQTSFFNMLIELPDTRVALRQMLGIQSWPQLLLRIGYSLEEPALSPRRAVEECMVSG
jgi:hypothetical protein